MVVIIEIKKVIMIMMVKIIIIFKPQNFSAGSINGCKYLMIISKKWKQRIVTNIW